MYFMIKVNHLELSFAEKLIFKDLSFSIEPGEKVCISGASGKGKSTILKMLMAYVIPNQGTIEINKLQINPENIKVIRNQMIWIPQNINLPVNNGLELMDLMEWSGQKNKVEELLLELGLAVSILSSDFSKISGGQKQRIIIAICLSMDKDIILMDEPTASLDEDSIDQLISCLSKFENKTMVSASHHSKWINSWDKNIAL
ncbi:ATP-binding cassette domain-containing protein [Lentimicrobium sp. S6]|nr:ATP-binding cassette domain-containing protein [Lentimicrobium sp. S6]